MSEAIEEPDTIPALSEVQNVSRPRRGGEKTCYNCGKASPYSVPCEGLCRARYCSHLPILTKFNVYRLVISRRIVPTPVSKATRAR